MSWLRDRLGIVRVRQLIDDLRHRLSFLPVALVVVAVVVSQLTLAIDRRLGEIDLPAPLETSVDSSRPVFATIAGGLITAVTLLLSMLLVAVQVASTNFSPRTLRNWLGDATLRWSIAIVMATIVFCLMGLRSVQTTTDAVTNPTVTVLIAVLLMLASLIAVIRAVDHVATNMQVGSVATTLVTETLSTMSTSRETFVSLSTSTPSTDLEADAPDDTVVIEAPKAGFVQQIDEQTIAEALPEGASAWIVVTHGEYLIEGEPLILVKCSEQLDDDDHAELRRAFALGSTRTMQQDLAFGLAQLTDIAVRALSPGINDPETASGVVQSIGEIMRELWSHESVGAVVEYDGRTIHRRIAEHGDLLRRALDPIRRHGRADPSVLSTIARVLQTLRSEVERRDLPGPLEPIDDFIADVAACAESEGWLERERAELDELTRRHES